MMQPFSVAQLHAAPWKNGGGVTREIVAMPRGAGLDTFAWRVSIADVSSDGPFSLFENVDRALVLLEGKGVVLRDADRRIIHHLDEPFVPFTFSGDDRITSSLIDGPSVDFNVMTRRGVADAELRVIRTREELAGRRSGVLFAPVGEWTVESLGDTPVRLRDGDGVWWEGTSHAFIVSPNTSDAVLLWVGVQY